MLVVKLPEELEKLLADMAKDSGRTAEEIALEAILERLEDWEDARIADERLKEGATPIPLEEVIAKYAEIDKT